MQAVVYDAVGAPPAVRDLPPPDCPVDGAVVRVRATGVCRSDWHAWRGHEEVPLPNVPGHEFAGVLDRVGAEVTRFTVGERVTAPFVNGCGRCGWCRRGDAQVCPEQTQPGFTHPGSFAEQVVVRAADTNLVRLPDTIGDVTAAALGCRFATAYRGVVTHGRVGPDDVVAVFGCGGVGLSAVLVARARGARVLAVDPSPVALARAVELGAEPVGPDREPVAAVLAAAPDGVTVAVDALGSANTAAASVRVLQRRGRQIQIGLMVGDDARAPLPWDLVVARELEVHGSHGMPAADYPELLELVVTGRLQPQLLAGSVITLGDAPAALTAMDDPIAARAGTTVIIFDDADPR